MALSPDTALEQRSSDVCLNCIAERLVSTITLFYILMLKQLRCQDFFFSLEKFLLQLGKAASPELQGRTGLSLLWGVSTPMVCISEQLGVIDSQALGLQ